MIIPHKILGLYNPDTMWPEINNVRGAEDCTPQRSILFLPCAAFI